MSRELSFAELCTRREERTQIKSTIARLRLRLAHVERELLDGVAHPEQLSLDTAAEEPKAKATAPAPKAKPAATATTATTAKKPEKASERPRKAPKAAATATTAKKPGKAARGAKPAPAPAPANLRKTILDVLADGDPPCWFTDATLVAMVRERLSLAQQPSDRELRRELRDLQKASKIDCQRDDGDGLQWRLIPPGRTSPEPKAAPAQAPRPTVAVGEAVNKMLAAYPPERWLKARAALEERFEAAEGQPIRTAWLYLHTPGLTSPEIDAVLVLLESACAVTREGRTSVETSAAVDEEGIAASIRRLTLDYVLGLVADRDRAPKTDDLAADLDLPRALVVSVLDELLAAGRLRRGAAGRWEVVTPPPAGEGLTPAQRRTKPLIPGVQPVPAPSTPEVGA